ncbi:CCCH RNA binding domain-containing protein [Cryptosporidium canis]|uniref:CCCH RNA binding domain-containing protein n=1 Tax=Cryptosporidium canis TaxID=195482 RepID=A0A9D5DGF9_9CRYT|nr:CCCH RNA binding domain-containing protein [Cryptosporidium canis]
MNNAKAPSELDTSIVTVQSVCIKASKSQLAKDDHSLVNESCMEKEGDKSGVIRASTHRKEFSKYAVLTKDELNQFRTILCNDHLNSKCLDPEICFNSHCAAWQRRNPKKFKYSSTICPDIEFLRKGGKGRMSLNCKCRKGKNCEFAHTKEEELYHPDSYKTKKCNAYPNCKRFYCPFIHECEFSSTNPTNNKSVELQNKIIPAFSKNLKSPSEITAGMLYANSPYKIKGIHGTNMSFLKQELLIKLVDCQKLVLEEKYSSAQNIAEDFTSLITSLCKSYFAMNCSSNGIHPNTTIPHELKSRERMANNLNENHMENAFRFSFDFKNFFEELKEII